MEVKKEFKVGSLVIAAFVILYFGIDFLKGSDVFNPARSFYVSFENIDGLTASNPVMLNGFQVGLVKKIRIYQGRKNPIVVELEINNDIMVGDSARAMLSNNGLLGGKMIVLDPGNQQKQLKSDTILPFVVPGFASMLEDRAQPMVDKITQLVQSVDMIVKSFEPTAGKMNVALESVTKLSNTGNQLMDDNKEDIKHITKNLETLSVSLGDAQKQLQTILVKVNKVGDSLEKADIAGTIHSIHQTTEQVNKTLLSINQGQGTMGKLMKSDSLYRSLSASSVSLNALLVDFKANPKRYVHFSVFGAKDKKAKQ